MDSDLETLPDSEHGEEPVCRRETTQGSATVQPKEPVAVEKPITAIEDISTKVWTIDDPCPWTFKNPKKGDRKKGTFTFPIAKVQKLLKGDKRILACEDEAAIVMAIAAEEFIFEFVRSTNTHVRKTNRKMISMFDFGDVLRKKDELSFLKQHFPATPPPAPKLPKFPVGGPRFPSRAIEKSWEELCHEYMGRKRAVEQEQTQTQTQTALKKRKNLDPEYDCDNQPYGQYRPPPSKKRNNLDPEYDYDNQPYGQYRPPPSQK